MEVLSVLGMIAAIVGALGFFVACFIPYVWLAWGRAISEHQIATIAIGIIGLSFIGVSFLAPLAIWIIGLFILLINNRREEKAEEDEEEKEIPLSLERGPRLPR